MKEKIETLTPEEAQKAIQYFYEDLPNELRDGSRLSPREIKFRSTSILEKEASNPDFQSFFTAIIDESDEPVRGKIAQIMLLELDKYETFRPDLEKAIERATGKMASRSDIAGALLVVMISIVSRIEFDENNEVNITPRLPDAGEIFVSNKLKEMISEAMDKKKKKKTN